jgi:excisionase family DNA binding protein
MSIKEAAEYVSLSPNYIRDMIADRKFPYIDISKGEKACYRFDRKELDKWIERQPGMKADHLID